MGMFTTLVSMSEMGKSFILRSEVKMSVSQRFGQLELHSVECNNN
jgi:hypothetical protein